MRKPIVIAGLLLAACTEHAPFTPKLGGPTASISDAVHEAGNAHFYFLPPLVGDPSPTGIFDASLLPYLSVTVCPWSGGACLGSPVAEFTAEAGTGSEIIRLAPEDEHYIVNWHSEGLASGTTYRIRVLAAGTELAHADVDVVDNGAGLRNVDTDEYVSLVDGRTLPIKFRIEEGAVFVVGAAGGMIEAGGGQVVLRIPEDALASPIGITVKPGAAASSDEGTIPGTLWEFGPDGTEFRVPAELTLRYASEALPPEVTDPATSLVLATQEGDEWVESPTTVDADAHSITGPVFGFSVKAVAVKTLDVDVQPSSLLLAPSASAELTSAARSQGGKVLTKRALKKIALDERVATVDASGAVRGVGVGSTVVRFTPRLPRLFPPGLDPCALPYVLCVFPRRDVPVVVRHPVASVTVSPATASVVVGGAVQLTAELRDAEGNVLTGREVAWASAADDLASVDAVGMVTGRAPGTTEILATSEGVRGSAEIEVVPVGGPREYTWTQLSSGTTRSLTEVWGASSSNVFAAASEFDILRFDGQSWSPEFGTLDTLSFRGLSGRNETDVYAVGGKRAVATGSCGGVTGRTSLAFALRFDGTAWRDAGFPFVCNSAHRGAWAGPQTILAVGNSPRSAVNLGDQLGRIWRLRDGSWTLEFTLFGDTLSAFLHAWGSAETDVYAVGGGNLFGSTKTPFGVIVHYDGVNWSVVSDEIEKPLNAVWGTSSSDVFAAGQEGLILHFDGTQWTRQESGVTVNLGGVWGSAPDNVFAVGGSGTILHYDGRTWMPLESNTITGLAAVWTTPSGDSVFAVGQGGLILLGTAQ